MSASPPASPDTNGDLHPPDATGEGVERDAATSAGERRLVILVMAAAVIAFALIRVPFLSMPLERDEGEYAYMAQLLLDGGVLYRDAFNQKYGL